MINLFDKGQPQSLPEVLANRDQRVKLQTELLIKNLDNDHVVVTVKLNVPGPIKNNLQIEDLFKQGLQSFTKKVDIVSEFSWQQNATGPETFLIVEGQSNEIKQLAIEFEDSHLLGRLFDIDVLEWNPEIQQAQPLSRKNLNQNERQCLICSQPAKVCARSRSHSVSDLQAAFNQRYQLYMEQNS